MDNLMNSKERDFISESLRDDEKGKIWVKPFAVSEKVDLKNFGKVDNKLYGTLVGMDLGIASFDNGVDMTYSAFTGYSLSKQNYDEVAIRQNGGVLGANVAFYKGNFFAGVSANIGLNDVKADTMYGSEKFTILTGGVASKVGYNFDIEDRSEERRVGKEC